MTSSSARSAIGFVGLGNLGQAMALHLVESGWNTRVLDLSDERTAPVTAAGASRIRVEELLDCDVICFAVPDEQAVDRVIEDCPDFYDTLSDRHTVVLHSTVVPSAAITLGERVTKTGAHFVEAPASGGAERARSGDLTLFAGGTEPDIEATRALLEAVASRILHLGPVGAGSACKLANQLVMFSALAGLTEGLRLAQHHGVETAAALEAFSSSTADTWVGRNWGFFDRVADDYEKNGTPLAERPWSKDLWEAVSAGRDAALHLPFAALLSQSLAHEVEEHARNNRKGTGA